MPVTSIERQGTWDAAAENPETAPAAGEFSGWMALASAEGNRKTDTHFRGIYAGRLDHHSVSLLVVVCKHRKICSLRGPDILAL
jgi:hypothetical protein